MRRLSIITLFAAALFVCLLAIISVLRAEEAIEPRPRPQMPESAQALEEPAAPSVALSDKRQELFMALTTDEDSALAALDRRQANGSLPQDAYEITAEYLNDEKRRTRTKVAALGESDAETLSQMLNASSFRPLMVHIDVDILLDLMASGFDPRKATSMSEAYAATMAARFNDHLAAVAQMGQTQQPPDSDQANRPGEFERLW